MELKTLHDLEVGLDALAREGTSLASASAAKRELHEKFKADYVVLKAEVDEAVKELNLLVRTAMVLSNIADETTKAALNKITSVINKTLALLFQDDARVLSITPTMYRNVYPHYVVTLMTGDGKVRTFKQSGDGIAQIISFLFTACVIDAKGGRKLMVTDEILRGLHPSAKLVVRDLLIALSARFQFVMVEYDFDIGLQYEVKKIPQRGISTVTAYKPLGRGYYDDIHQAGIDVKEHFEK